MWLQTRVRTQRSSVWRVCTSKSNTQLCSRPSTFLNSPGSSFLVGDHHFPLFQRKIYWILSRFFATVTRIWKFPKSKSNFHIQKLEIEIRITFFYQLKILSFRWTFYYHLFFCFSNSSFFTSNRLLSDFKPRLAKLLTKSLPSYLILCAFRFYDQAKDEAQLTSLFSSVHANFKDTVSVISLLWVICAVRH